MKKIIIEDLADYNGKDLNELIRIVFDKTGFKSQDDLDCVTLSVKSEFPETIVQLVIEED